MKKTTLVIMAAGIGSRFGGGIKQLEPVGPCGEIIMDYSIYDAIEAGFNKVVFIIRKDIEEDFKRIIGDRIEKYIETEYVYQETSIESYGFETPADRKKPWGTGHAVLSCYGVVKEPFMVINADDYYGKQAFVSVHDYLINTDSSVPGTYCMAGFVLGNTLSDNGTVKRGICKTNSNDYLMSVEECTELRAVEGGVEGRNRDGEYFVIPYDTPVSMNMFGFTEDFLEQLKGGFTEFLEGLSTDGKLGERAVSAEFYLPSMVSELIDSGKAGVKVLTTTDRWIGVTYREDKPMVVEAINKLVEQGVYPEGLLSKPMH
ncbi:MAG: sugar phosphate nucleotidyltransferase [Lachnospiraceae bacterium]